MRRLLRLLLPAALFCDPGFTGEARYARLGELDGKVEMQLRAGDPWVAAVRNTPLLEGSWLRTAAGARAEVELDEGSVLRLADDSLCELSDYTRLSTRQRITLLSVDRGVAYFTGAAESKDALILAVPGAQVTVEKGARLRLEARDDWSQIAVLEGTARFSSPTAELELKEGQMARVAPSQTGKFYLYREVSSLDSDRWSEQRDKFFASSSSATHVRGLRYGLQDLDANGAWITTDDFGTVWKPKAPDTWAPFRNGKWTWYDALGFTWIGDEPWGWLPYHYGRWMQLDSVGWFWVPGKSAVFKPGDVYWLRGANLAGWGPLAPGEDWNASVVPRLYLNANTTFANFSTEAREIDPASFTNRPKEPLIVAKFALAPPSPPFLTARLEASRPVLRAGSTRIVPLLPGVTYEGAEVVQAAQAPEPPPPPAPSLVIQPPPAQPPVIVALPQPERAIETYYPAPVYTGIVVVNPPEHEHHARRPPPPPPAAPVKPSEQPKPAPPPIPRVERSERRAVDRPPAPEPPKQEADERVPRNKEEIAVE
jgi:hypothetical protein